MTKIGFNINLDNLIEFCKRNNRLPCSNGENGNLERRLYGFMYRNRHLDEIKNIHSKYRKVVYHSFQENLSEFINFYKINKRLPNSDSTLLESRLKSFYHNHKDKILMHMKSNKI